MSKIPKPVVALLSAFLIMTPTSVNAEDIFNPISNPNELKFYSDDILIAQYYKTKKQQEQIDDLRLASHSHSVEEMAENIDDYFKEHGCELAGYGDTFVDAGLESRVDPYFLAAISIIESTGGNHCVREHNAWGRKAGGKNGDKYNRISSNGWCTWPSWEDAIHDEADYIARVYLDEGRTSVHSIARKYCPPTSSSWAANVSKVKANIAD